ncbi:hypothetical protein [Hymenobacter glacieicola]|uniref:Uncharacterized protein n=1 Tax=Hymenobacter glacieicola TaxID=1562124 RepID=A0ABQ1WLF2_9BACT|nr:hypothetical protein [Hymenobacter glacieicola]GGG36951.1 hypothetical protein GCM10011378_11640 [Hymenobacter glacieicola]
MAQHATDPLPGFDPNAGTPIDPATAEQWTKNYRQQPATEAELTGAKRINAYYFSNQLLDDIKQQAGCVGLRFYMGLDKPKAEENKQPEYQLLVVGVDKNGYDIVPRPAAGEQPATDDGIVGDGSSKCPSVCDPTSPLQTGA